MVKVDIEYKQRALVCKGREILKKVVFDCTGIGFQQNRNEIKEDELVFYSYGKIAVRIEVAHVGYEVTDGEVVDSEKKKRQKEYIESLMNEFRSGNDIVITTKDLKGNFITDGKGIVVA
jgi:hypothetical protein